MIMSLDHDAEDNSIDEMFLWTLLSKGRKKHELVPAWALPRPSIKWILHLGMLFSLALNLGCAYSPTAGSLIGLRFLSGFSGSISIACGGGVVSDLFSESERGPAMSLYVLGPFIGPAIGPVVGGFTAQTIGVSYVFVILAGLCFLSVSLGIPFLQETYAPVIRTRKAAWKGDLEKTRLAWQGVEATYGNNKRKYLWINLTRPIVLLFKSFILFILSLYMAFMYGINFLMLATFPKLFSETYGFDTGSEGLGYLGLGIGLVLATTFSAKFADRIYAHFEQFKSKNGGIGKPEMRIPAVFLGSVIVPIGLLWYGWSAQERAHWIMPIIGSGVYGFGMMTTFLPLQLYIADTFTYAASALAAATVFRSMLGFAFPLFGQQMFDYLGLGNGYSMLAGITVVLGIPFPVWIYFLGEKIRARSTLNK